jgi:hypothetical protein
MPGTGGRLMVAGVTVETTLRSLVPSEDGGTQQAPPGAAAKAGFRTDGKSMDRWPWAPAWLQLWDHTIGHTPPAA